MAIGSLRRTRQGRRNRTVATTQTDRKNPHILSIEGMVVLALAVIFDLVNVVLAVLDFFIIGLIISPFFNAIPLALIGGWLWLRTGQDIKKNKEKAAPH